MNQQTKKTTRQGRESNTAVIEAKPEVIAKGKATVEEIDNIMDDIDDVLEENAQEFVKNYVQKGGE